MKNQIPGIFFKDIDNIFFSNNQKWNDTVGNTWQRIDLNSYLGFSIISDYPFEIKLHNETNNAILIEQSGTFYFENMCKTMWVRCPDNRANITVISNIDLTTQRLCDLMQQIKDLIEEAIMHDIKGELLSGTVDGSNDTFTTANVFVSLQTAVYVNGVRQDRGVHYNEQNGNEIVFIHTGTTPGVDDFRPQPGDDPRIDYKYM